MSRCRLVMAALLATLLPGATSADDLTTLLAGPPGPARLRDLGSGWLTFRYSRPSAAPAVPGLSAFPMMGTAGQAAPATYYTRGQRVTVGGKAMLVAYTVEAAGLDLPALLKASEGRGPGTPAAVINVLSPVAGPDAPVSLQLLALDGVSLEDLQPYSRSIEVARRRPMQPNMPILAAILLPAFAQARRAAQETTDLSNLRQLGLGIHTYGADHGKLPPMQSLSAAKRALMPYLRNTEVFAARSGAGYRLNSQLSGMRFKLLGATDVLAYCPTSNGTGSIAVLFGDGSARQVEAAEWQRIRDRARLR